MKSGSSSKLPPERDALDDPKRMLAEYFPSANIGIGIVDRKLRYIAINDALAQMSGLPAADYLGKAVGEAPGSFASRAEAEFRRALLSEESVHFDFSGPDASTEKTGRWRMHCLPIADDDGSVSGIGGVLVDLSMQEMLRESAQEAGEKLRQVSARMQLLLDVGGILSSNWNLREVFPRISARIRRLLHHEFAALAMLDPTNGLLVRQAEDFPLGRGLLTGIVISLQNTPGGRALQQGTSLIFSKEQLLEFDADITRALMREGIQSLCCIPLLRPNGPPGVLVLGSTRGEAFHAEDLPVLNQIAAQLAVTLENHHAVAEIERLRQRFAQESKYLEGEIRAKEPFAEIVGESHELEKVLVQVATVAESDATVLILGETGTGKELIAHAIHRLSRRSQGNFIKVNCAAIPTGLLESELFGHEKGAFTGAISQKIGRLEIAHGGTLFLDEIGEISLELQPKLLRVLQDQEFERLGSNRTIRVNVRMIAATNRDLGSSMAENLFRRDLFYRLSVFPIQMPALRERREDIPLLVRHFVRKFAQRMERHIETVPKETMQSLLEWSWPGNVRELENLMERSVIMSEGSALRVPLGELNSRKVQRSPVPSPDDSLESAEREHIVRVLRETGGMLSGPNGAAHRLGLKRTTLQSKMQRLRITRSDYSSD